MPAELHLLKRAIRCLVEGALVERLRKNFNFETFKKVPAAGKAAYAMDTLERLGSGEDIGSSRAAFILGTNKVLKVALNKAGVAQNENEVEVYTDPKVKPIVTRIVSNAPDYVWIASEMARPIANDKEWADWSGGITLRDLRAHVLYPEKSEAGDHNKDEVMKNPIAIGVAILAKKDLLRGDTLKLGSWGKTGDGRLVLLDYGATKEIFKKHYTGGGAVKSDEEEARPGSEERTGAASPRAKKKQ